MKRVSILGSTGSIGRQSLQVIEAHSDRFTVRGLAAGENLDELCGQIARHRPAVVSVATAKGAGELAERLAARNVDPLPEIGWGPQGIECVATDPDADVLISAAVGVAGLPATYKAVQIGKPVALANKEVLVAAGELVSKAARQAGVSLLPIDSEHCAIHQCLRSGERRELKRLLLTASGGPFRKTPLSRMKDVTPEQALAHPNWKMGRRITIDSATLTNKGFEVIEARWLFDAKPEQIDVVIHPQSTVHSMVEFVDGSVVAQIGPPDMRIPIQYALTFPERLPANGFHLDWTRLRLDFEPVPERKFPCLGLARQAMTGGGALPCALNAADEVAVEEFLQGRLRFIDIPRVIERVLERMGPARLESIGDVLEADAEARRLASEEARRNGRPV
ncbi:MAG TPA: 1-deoxy-D-xylulose-5-phosphate reductoisomerase [Candidatus Dormibacteraeota bacterium]|nr:1-deoxy-D-xylulose-5-phosphate reductoisomerase [Candidatus Dormibacteraeota bacterium]